MRDRALTKIIGLALAWSNRVGPHRLECAGDMAATLTAGFSAWLDGPTSGSLDAALAGPPMAVWAAFKQTFPQFAILADLSERVLTVPASEAQSERTIGQIRRVLGQFSYRTGPEALIGRVRLRMARRLVPKGLAWKRL
jgi:hypothetical protein